MRMMHNHDGTCYTLIMYPPPSRRLEAFHLHDIFDPIYTLTYKYCGMINSVQPCICDVEMSSIMWPTIFNMINVVIKLAPKTIALSNYYKHDTSSSFIDYSTLNGEHNWRAYIFSEGINNNMYIRQP
jgi:hypothetical protein